MVQIFVTQLATEQLLKFPPHPMCASALPRENGTHKIGRKPQKHANIINCNLKNDDTIIITLP